MFDLSEEYRQVASTHDVDWVELSGSSVLVTGATGLVGSLFVRALLERNRGFGLGITVYALVRSEEKARRAFEGYGPSDGLHFVVQDVCELSLDVSCDYILHAACPTASAFFTSHPAQTADAIVMGTRAVLEYARRCGCRSVVYVSSMEVYGEGNHEPGLAHALTESETGIVDPLAVRSCYPEGKRMAENYCAAYASEYGVPVKIARLAQTFGPGVPKDDKRLFAQIARSAMLGDDLVLKTTGASTRMYVYTADAIRALLAVLLKGEKGSAYNVANPATYCSVREMAELVLERFSGGRAHVVVDVDPNAPYPPEHHLPLDVSRLESLGWAPTTSLEGMYENLICYLS